MEYDEIRKIISESRNSHILTNRPPNIPTEDPSNNPTIIPVQEEGKSNNADAKRNMTLTLTPPPVDSNIANMLSGSNADANIDRNTILPDDSVTHINDNSTQVLERRLKELHGGSSANSYTNNRRDVSQILNTSQPIFNNPNIYSPGAIPPVPTNITPPTFNQPVTPASTPPESLYSGILDSVCSKISNFTSVCSYLTGSRDIGSNLRNNVEDMVPSKTSVLTSVAISVIGIGVHFLVNTYTSTKTGTFIRNVPGMIKREDMVD